MKILHLPVKRELFEMIESNVKWEEYRAVNHYWAFRLFTCGCDVRRRMCKALAKQNNARYTCASCPLAFARHYDGIEFRLGCTKRDDGIRRVLKRFKYVKLGRGKVEWGAPKDEDVIIIGLGEFI